MVAAKYLFVFSCTFLSLCLYSSAHNKTYIPYTHSKFISDNNIHAGILETYNGEKILGNFAYNNFFARNFLSYSKSGKQINKYKYKDVKSIVLLGSDSVISRKDSTFFIKLFDKKDYLYRQLTFGEVEIFDQYFNVNYTHGLVGNYLVIRYKGKLYTVGTRKRFTLLIRSFAPEKIMEFSKEKFLSVTAVIKKFNSY